MLIQKQTVKKLIKPKALGLKENPDLGNKSELGRVMYIYQLRMI